MLSINFLSFVIIVFIGTTQAQLDNKQIYKIVNKADNGVLTLSSSDLDSPGVTLKTWKDNAGQKWRVKQPVLAKSYEFRPTSNEKVYLDADSSNLKIYGRDPSTGNTKYWKVRDMGEGVMQIKNYQIGTCLGSQGLDSPVKLVACDNSKATQWTFVHL